MHFPEYLERGTQFGNENLASLCDITKERKTFIKIFYENVGFQIPVKCIFIFEQGTIHLLL